MILYCIFHKLMCSIQPLRRGFNLQLSFWSKAKFRPCIHLTGVLQDSCVHLPHFPNVKLIHGVKGWKLTANPELAANLDGQKVISHNCCEEGTGAVIHDELLHRLNNCKTVTEQLNTMHSALTMTTEEIQKRKQLCDSLYELFKPFFPNCTVQQYGSSINTLGFPGCDVDICIETMPNVGDKPSEYTKIPIPTVDQVLNGEVDLAILATLHPKIRLRFMRRIMYKYYEDVESKVFLFKARCPILRFYSKKFDLYCDFSCENKSAIQNTKLLRFICHFDKRVSILLKTLRYWGKHKKFVGDIEMFSSYGFSLLVVYFLQNTTPPVLPPLKELTEKCDYIKYGDTDDDDLLFRSLKNIPPSQNKQTAEELFREFFFFYAFYNFRKVILVLSGTSVPLADFRCYPDVSTGEFEVGTVCLQDPYRLWYNATSGIVYKNAAKFLSSLIEACNLYQNENIWQPNMQNWGISLLLDSSGNLLNEEDSSKEKLETIMIKLNPEMSEKLSLKQGDEQLKFVTKASDLVKEILEHGLLFECRSFKQNQSSCDTMLVKKFSCTVPYITWTGRHQVLKEFFSDTIIHNPLELEHEISQKLVQERSEKKLNLFKFRCDCYLENINDTPVLKVDMNFHTGKYACVVSIFLKEYIPKLLKQLL